MRSAVSSMSSASTACVYATYLSCNCHSQCKSSLLDLGPRRLRRTTQLRVVCMPSLKASDNMAWAFNNNGKSKGVKGDSTYYQPSIYSRYSAKAKPNPPGNLLRFSLADLVPSSAISLARYFYEHCRWLHQAHGTLKSGQRTLRSRSKAVWGTQAFHASSLLTYTCLRASVLKVSWGWKDSRICKTSFQ